MNLSASNIAWPADLDPWAYGELKARGFTGLEIAPTRLFPEKPYDHAEEMARYVEDLKETWGLRICSMQSILYGRSENLFEHREREVLLEYLGQAFAFGKAAGGCNFVFGCPRNRVLPDGKEGTDAISFFEAAAEAALNAGCVLSLEANPPTYGTNFINTTKEAFAFARRIPGLKVNLDTGTMIGQGESLRVVRDNLDLVNHVHISEPGLVSICRRDLHRELAELLKEKEYTGFVSVEMGQTTRETILSTLDYVSEVFS